MQQAQPHNLSIPFIRSCACCLLVVLLTLPAKLPAFVDWGNQNKLIIEDRDQKKTTAW